MGGKRPAPPETDNILKAANTIIKLDLAILKAEMDAGISERKLGTFDVKLPQLAPLDPDAAAKITEVFNHWSMDLTLPEKRPKLIEITVVDIPSQSEDRRDGKGRTTYRSRWFGRRRGRRVARRRITCASTLNRPNRTRPAT
jgi:hypothetical protein